MWDKSRCTTTYSELSKSSSELIDVMYNTSTELRPRWNFNNVRLKWALWMVVVCGWKFLPSRDLDETLTVFAWKGTSWKLVDDNFFPPDNFQHDLNKFVYSVFRVTYAPNKWLILFLVAYMIHLRSSPLSIRVIDSRVTTGKSWVCHKPSIKAFA
jgi:hypothetical protein